MASDNPTTGEPPARDLVERLIERRDALSIEAAEAIMGIRGANKRLREMAHFAKVIANVRDQGVLVHEVRVGEGFLRELRAACGVQNGQE